MTKRKEGVIPRKTNSGYQDINLTPQGRFKIVITGDNRGTFDEIEKAIKARDEYRKLNHLPPAKY